MDILKEENITNLLNTDFIGKKIIYFYSIDSTNTHAKSIGNESEDGTVSVYSLQIYFNIRKEV